MLAPDYMQDEFIPLTYFNHFLKYWWIVVLTALLGGLIGYISSHLHSSLYEARALITVNVDLTKVTEFPLEYHDEAQALYNIQVALLDTQTIHNVIRAASQEDISLDSATILKNQTIERKLVFWEVRFRDKNPVAAQKFVNLWISEALKTFQKMQEAGKIPEYVIIQGTTPAEIPQTPIYALPSWLTLAGGIVGLVIGILSIETFGTRLQNHL